MIFGDRFSMNMIGKFIIILVEKTLNNKIIIDILLTFSGRAFITSEIINNESLNELV